MVYKISCATDIFKSCLPGKMLRLLHFPVKRYVREANRAACAKPDSKIFEVMQEV